MVVALNVSAVQIPNSSELPKRPLHRSVEAAPAPAALAPLAAGRGSDRAAAVAYLHAVLLYFGLVIIIVRFASHNEW